MYYYYIIKIHDNRIKVGITKNTDQRIKSYRTSDPTLSYYKIYELDIEKKDVEDKLAEILKADRGELKEIKIDNPDYDPEFAKIGREPETEENSESEEEEESSTKKAKQQKLDF